MFSSISGMLSTRAVRSGRVPLAAAIALMTFGVACSSDEVPDRQIQEPVASQEARDGVLTPTSEPPSSSETRASLGEVPTATIPPRPTKAPPIATPATPEPESPAVGRFLIPNIFPGGMIHDGENIWLVHGGGDGFIGKISPEGKSLGVFRAAREGVKGMAFDGTHIWTSDRLENEIRKLNLQGETVERIPIRLPGALRFDGESMWVELDKEEWVRLSLDGQELARRTTPPGVLFRGSFWTINEDRTSVLETFEDGTVLKRIALEETPVNRGSGITVDGDVFWLTTGIDSTTRLDPITGSQLTFVSGPRTDAAWVDGRVPIGGGMIVTDTTVWVTTGSDAEVGTIVGFTKDGEKKGSFSLEPPPGNSTTFGDGMLFFRVRGRIFAVAEADLEAALTPDSTDSALLESPVDQFNQLERRPFPRELFDSSEPLSDEQVESLWENWLGDGVGGYVYADVSSAVFDPDHELHTDGNYVLTSTFYNCGDGGNVHGGYDPNAPDYSNVRFWVQIEQDESGSWNDVLLLMRDPRDKEAPPFFTARMWVDGKNPVQSAGDPVPDFWILVKELDEEAC